MASVLSLKLLPGEIYGSKGSDRLTIHDLLPFDPSTQQTATDTGSQISNKSLATQTGTISSTDQTRNFNTSDKTDIIERTISVKGRGVMEVKPDMATVSLSIVTSRDTENATLAANSATFNEVRGLMKNLIDYKNQSSRSGSATNTSSLTTNSLFIKRDNLSKYTVVRNMVISTSNINNMPYWITEIGKLGVNMINNIQFNLTNENMDKARINVMEKAMKDAWFNARDAAILLGVRVIGIKSLAIGSFVANEQVSYPKEISPASISSWFRDFSPSLSLEMNITQSFLFKPCSNYGIC